MTPEEELDLFGADDSVADENSSSTGTGDVQMEMQTDDHSYHGQENAQAHSTLADAEPRVVGEQVPAEPTSYLTSAQVSAFQNQFHRALALGLFPVPASSSSHAGRAALQHGAFPQQPTFAPVGMPPYPGATLSHRRVDPTPAIQYTLPPPPNAFTASSASHFPDARRLTPLQQRPRYEQDQHGRWFAFPAQRPPPPQYYQAPDATIASRYAYPALVPRNFDGGIPRQATPSFPFLQASSPLAGYAAYAPSTSTLSGAFAQPSGAGRATPAVPMSLNHGRVQATTQAQAQAPHNGAFLAQTQGCTTGGIYSAHPDQITGPRPERALPRRALPLHSGHGSSVGGGAVAGPSGGVSGLSGQNYAVAPPPPGTHLSVLPPTTADSLEFVQDDAAFPVVAVAKKRKRKQREQSDSDATHDQPPAKKVKKKNTSMLAPPPRPTPPGRESIEAIIAKAQPEHAKSTFDCMMPCRCPGHTDQSQPCRGRAPCHKDCRGGPIPSGTPGVLATHLVRCHSLLREGKGGPKIRCVWRSPSFASGSPAACTEILEQHKMAAHITKDHLRATWKRCQFCRELFPTKPKYELHLQSCEEYWNPTPWATEFPKKS
ncbi:hypothetical protein C8R46DRAFT_1030305 [Mycena filopes]|nr:hypothetical protein C8R46DRAFT_1030305 [Mycena filopes]